MDTTLILMITGSLILFGVLGIKFFDRTRIPNPLLIMLAGMIVGPITNLILIVPTEAAAAGAPHMTQDILFQVVMIVGALSLVLIMFEGGLELELDKVRKAIWPAMLLGGLTFLVSATLVFGFLYFWSEVVDSSLNLTVGQALLVAFILGGTSPAIVIPVVHNMSISKDLKAFFAIESTVSEVLTVISVLLTISVLESSSSGEGVEGWGIGFTIIYKVGIALVFAFIGGIFWSTLGIWLRGLPLAYMLTLSFIFILYAVVDWIGGEAVLATLMFGFIMANAHIFAERVVPFMKRIFVFDIKATRFIVDQFQVKFNAELSFLMRLVFFFFMGMLMDVGEWGAGVILLIVLMVALLLVGRWAPAWVVTRATGLGREAGRTVTSSLFPRGLACAIMAVYAKDSGVLPDAGTFDIIAMIFGIILVTNLAMGIVFQFVRDPEPVKVSTDSTAQALGTSDPTDDPTGESTEKDEAAAEAEAEEAAAQEEAEQSTSEADAPPEESSVPAAPSENDSPKDPFHS